MILLQKNTKLMEGLVVNTVYQNLHTSCRDFLHLLAQFPTPLPFLSSPGIALKSLWKNSRLVIFLSKGRGQLDSSPPLIEKTPIVPELSFSTNFFSIST